MSWKKKIGAVLNTGERATCRMLHIRPATTYRVQWNVCVCVRARERWAVLQYLLGPDVSVMILACLYVLSGVPARVINTDKHTPASRSCGCQNALSVHILRFAFIVIRVNICYYRFDILHTHTYAPSGSYLTAHRVCVWAASCDCCVIRCEVITRERLCWTVQLTCKYTAGIVML